MNYCNIKPYTIENGEGIRVSLFVSGCRNHCKGCFQPETWDFNYGKKFDDSTIDIVISLLDNPNISGLTILGGEPFEPENQPDVLKLILAVRKQLPNKTIWIYTGNSLEKDLLKGKNHLDNITESILHNIDVLIDGPYIEAKKNLSIPFRGSTNQRILYRGKDF